jgi:1-acyl-sn-glycerol-3-phosphate acyltransferase
VFAVQVSDADRVSESNDCAQLDVRWARGPLGRALRAVALGGFFETALHYYTRRRRDGVEHLDGLQAPVVFVATHSSHIDTPIILRALPRRWRRRTVVAAAVDYFYTSRRMAWLVSVLFSTVPVRREGGGVADLDHIDRLLSGGWSLVVYPEGSRRREREDGRLRTGAAVLSATTGAAIVPVHLAGTRASMPPGQIWPKRKLWQRRYPVTITFGEPIWCRSVAERHAATAVVQAFFDTHDPPRRAQRPPSRQSPAATKPADSETTRNVAR